MNKSTLILILTVILTAFSPTLLHAEFYLLVNNKLNIDSIHKSEVKSIFLGRKILWDSGAAITPCYLLPDNEKENSFFNSIIKKDHARYIRYWNKKLFSGSGNPPEVIDTVEELLIHVNRNKGSICFVDSIPKSLPKKVKVITINE